MEIIDIVNTPLPGIIEQYQVKIIYRDRAGQEKEFSMFSVDEIGFKRALSIVEENA
ncbi:MAG: hypothetical protein INR69_14915 [Mucilaginibacter polytrichastri]|nr:hypothetical protein [Mucilaginibacter polytrichastri]